MQKLQEVKKDEEDFAREEHNLRKIRIEKTLNNNKYFAHLSFSAKIDSLIGKKKHKRIKRIEDLEQKRKEELKNIFNNVELTIDDDFFTMEPKEFSQKSNKQQIDPQSPMVS